MNVESAATIKPDSLDALVDTEDVIEVEVIETLEDLKGFLSNGFWSCESTEEADSVNLANEDAIEWLQAKCEDREVSKVLVLISKEQDSVGDEGRMDLLFKAVRFIVSGDHCIHLVTHLYSLE